LDGICDGSVVGDEEKVGVKDALNGGRDFVVGRKVTVGCGVIVGTVAGATGASIVGSEERNNEVGFEGLEESSPVGDADSIFVGDAVLVGASVGKSVSGDEVSSIVGVLVLFTGTNVVDMSTPCKDRTHAKKSSSF
jgi:hypothetical protein